MERSRKPAVLMAGLLLLALTACSGGAPTVTEYAEQIEDLVADMAARFTALDAEWVSGPPTPERAATYWEGRLEIRHDFLGAVQQVTPPERVAGMHAEAVDVFTRITDADEALAVRAAAFDTLEDHWQWVDTPEGQAADAVLADVWEFCRDSQAEFDATEQGEAFEGVPWVPREMQEAVKVAFGCPPGD